MHRFLWHCLAVVAAGLLRLATALGLILCLGMASCASTTFKTADRAAVQPLCQASGQPLSALVLWRAQWRVDQKDQPMREEAARAGLVDFLASSACYSAHELRRLAEGEAGVDPSPPALQALARRAVSPPDRVVLVTVRELGPVVKLLGSAALVEGGTEVVLDIVAVDVPSGRLLARQQTHWQHGGAMVVKGTASLPQDMSAALAASFGRGAPSR